MPYNDYVAQRTASLLDRISKDKTIVSTNKKTVTDFLNFMRTKGLKPATLHKNLYYLVSYLKILGKKDALTVTKEDVESTLAIFIDEPEVLTDPTLKLFVELCKEKIVEEQERQKKELGKQKVLIKSV